MEIGKLIGIKELIKGERENLYLIRSLIVPNPRFGRPPSWKIPNDHISGMNYPIHFHELQSSVGGIQEKIMREE